MNEFHLLAARARGGDKAAASTLRRELESQMTVIVRRAMRTRTGASGLGRRILAEAERQAPDGWDHAGGNEALVGRVARRVCEAVLDDLRVAPPGGVERETVRL